MADFVQSLGILLTSHWLDINSIEPGAYCNFQAIVLNCGDLGSAMWTFVVALTTFLSIAGGRQTRDWINRKTTSGKTKWFVSIGIWGFNLFIAMFGLIFIQPLYPEKGPYCT